jgi:hypothetical protein
LSEGNGDGDGDEDEPEDSGRFCIDGADARTGYVYAVCAGGDEEEEEEPGPVQLQFPFFIS